MSRSPSPLLLVATLTLGVAAGVALDRGGPYVSAQATRGNHTEPTATALVASREAPAKPSSETDLYQRLVR